MAFGQLNKRCKDGSRRFYEDEIRSVEGRYARTREGAGDGLPQEGAKWPPSPANLRAPLSGSLLSMMDRRKSGKPLFCGVWSEDEFSVEGPEARRNDEASDKFGQGSMSRTRPGCRQPKVARTGCPNEGNHLDGSVTNSKKACAL